MHISIIVNIYNIVYRYTCIITLRRYLLYLSIYINLFLKTFNSCNIHMNNTFMIYNFNKWILIILVLVKQSIKLKAA